MGGTEAEMGVRYAYSRDYKSESGREKYQLSHPFL